MKLKIKVVLVITSIIIGMTNVYAQGIDSTKSNIEFTPNVDIYSRFLWRGMQLSTSPSIQPTVKMVNSKLTLGYWGTYQFDGATPETDLYVSYSLPKGFGVTITDYFVSASDVTIGDYFDIDKATTFHVMEGALTYTGSEKFPISLLYGYNFYGTAAYKGSMYAEASYPIKNLTVILGAGNEIYTGKTESDWAIVNAGVKVVKTIKVTNDFSIPLTGQLMLNPYAQKLFYTIGFSF